jgi:hypothetical protein
MYIIDSRAALGGQPVLRPERENQVRPGFTRKSSSAKATKVDISSDARKRVQGDSADRDADTTSEEPAPKGRVPPGVAEDSAVQSGPRFMSLKLFMEKLLAKRVRALVTGQEEPDEAMDGDEEQVENDEDSEARDDDPDGLPLQWADGTLRDMEGRVVSFAQGTPATRQSLEPYPGPALELTDARNDVELDIAGRSERISFVRDEQGALTLRRSGSAPT